MGSNTRRFTWDSPVIWNGNLYPTGIYPIMDDQGNTRNRTVFVDEGNQYHTINDEGREVPMALAYQLPEVTVTGHRPMKSAESHANDLLTLSNDMTQVNNFPHRRYNTNLDYQTQQGAKSNATWREEHPNAAAWGDALGAVPFAVAAYPFVAGAGEYAAGTALGQSITNGLNLVANAPRVKAALPWIDAALTSYTGAEGMEDIGNGRFTPETAMDLMPLVQMINYSNYGLLEKAAQEAWHSKWAQYPRYYTGKLWYGNDVELPTLYRKIKEFPKIKDGKIIISNPNNRFRFTDGTQSPIITNMTTDVPVRSHSKGNWDTADVIAFPGKTLLGKKVISTRPSDTFTFGDNIVIDPSKATYFTGSDYAIEKAQKSGMKAVTSDEAKRIFYDTSDTQSKPSNRFLIEKDSGTKDYSDELQLLTRKTFKSPTIKDYKFMDWVFQPEYKSEVFPFVDLSKVKIGEIESLPEQLSSRLGNASLRSYLLAPKEWRNVIYDPATSAESKFRDKKHIIEKKKGR